MGNTGVPTYVNIPDYVSKHFTSWCCSTVIPVVSISCLSVRMIICLSMYIRIFCLSVCVRFLSVWVCLYLYLCLYLCMRVYVCLVIYISNSLYVLWAFFISVDWSLVLLFLYVWSLKLHIPHHPLSWKDLNHGCWY